MRIKKVLPICVLFFMSFAVGIRAEEVLTWEDCVREAARNNPDLISAAESINGQKAASGAAKSGLLPQITADANAATSKSSGSTSDSYSYGISASQLLFDGFKTVNNVNSAGEKIKAAEEVYRFTSSDVRFNLRGAFVNLLRAQELINVAEEIFKIRRDNLMLITLRYRSGLEHRGALATAEANAALANFQLSQAKRNLEFAERELIKQMGNSEFRPVYVKGDWTVIDAAEEKPDFEDIVKNNPSVLEAASKKNSAAFDVKTAYGGFAPEVSASAGADKSGAKWPLDNEGYNLGVRLNVPIFEGGLKIAQLNQAKSAYRRAEADERSVRNNTIVSLEEAWVLLRDAVETVAVQRKSLEAAEERSKVAKAQYSTGFVTFDNWIIIEDDLVRAKRNYLDAEANALLAEAKWIYAKGETLEYAQEK